MKLKDLVFILLVLLAAGCRSGKPDSTEEAAAGADEIAVTNEQFSEAGMRIGDPQNHEFGRRIRLTGYVDIPGTAVAEVSPMTAGFVSRIHVVPGQYVRQGAAMFTLRSSEYVEVQQQYATAFHRMQGLAKDLERIKSLAAENITAQKNLVNAQSEYRQVEAEVTGLRTRLRLLNISPSRVEAGNISPAITVYSPIAGNVSKLSASQGQQATPGDVLAMIINSSQMILRLSAFGDEAGYLKPGAPITFTVPGNNAVHQGRIRQTGKMIDRGTNTLEVYATIEPDSKSDLVVGMHVEADLVSEPYTALGLPNTAIHRSGDHSYVFVQTQAREGNHYFKRVPVTLGTVGPDYTEIKTANLKQVLLEGGFNLGIE